MPKRVIQAEKLFPLSLASSHSDTVLTTSLETHLWIKSARLDCPPQEEVTDGTGSYRLLLFYDFYDFILFC